MSSDSADGSTVVSDQDVRIKRRTTHQSGGVVVGLSVSTTADDPMVVRFAETLPDDVSATGVYVHPEYQPSDTVFVDGHLLFETAVAPGETEQVRYAVDNREADQLADQATEFLDMAVVDPEAAEFDPQTVFGTTLSDSLVEDDRHSPGDTDDTHGGTSPGGAADGDGNGVGEGESLAISNGGADDTDETAAVETEDDREGPSFGSGVENLEPDEADPTASFARGGTKSVNAGDSASEKPGPETPGPETPGPETPGPETPDAQATAPDTPTDTESTAPSADDQATASTQGTRGQPDPPGDASMVERLIDEIEAGSVDDETVDSLRDALGVTSPKHIEVKVDRIQSQIADIEAYGEVMEQFIDQQGTATEIVEDLRDEIRAVREELADTDEEIERLRDDLATTAEDIQAIREDVAATDADVADISGTVDDHAQHLDDLASVQTSLEDRTESLAETTADVADSIETVANEVGDLTNRHEQDVVDIWDEIEELEELREKLSAAFAGMGAEAESVAETE